MRKILVANRGEIALRIMRTIRNLGIRTVAVYSDADRQAPHVKFADEAIRLGPPPSAKSYLNIEAIIDAAHETGADAIHPGYGFLSENDAFARAVENAGLVFIGPPPSAIEIMGSKLAAKDAVKKYDIPMVPGSEGAVSDKQEILTIAKKIGLPVLIKASAGGGGKGMRLVHEESELEEQVARSVSEAKSSFGDGDVFIEKYITSPRHIEIQILADTFGHIVYLFERECSIQRRHQKVVEEAPSVFIDASLRARMGEAAVRVAQSCGYVGAGTVEFLMDHDHNFYFLEMNTRLQVEHPVTEMITGIDLVACQIQIARGEKLPFRQEDLRISGHAIELRVYAEDPTQNFMPSTGVFETYKEPVGEGIRVDSGYEEGMEIPIFYDPMISKLIVHDKTRIGAIRKMLKAIADYKIQGVSTTLSFGDFVFTHEAFLEGNFDTHFIQDHYQKNGDKGTYDAEAEVAALSALYFYLHDQKRLRHLRNGGSMWINRLHHES